MTTKKSGSKQSYYVGGQSGVFMEWSSWTPEQVTNLARRALEKNSPIVAKYIEDEARRELLSIRKPAEKRPKSYRFYLAKAVLAHMIKTDETGTTIYVGMKIGQRGQTHHGFYIEVGSKTAPAHPYLRPALFNNTDEILALFTETGMKAQS